VGSAYALADGDFVLPLHRDMVAHIVRGQTLERLLLQYLGRQEGMTRGRDGGSNVGEVHEGLAIASVMRLPLLLVIENNQYAYSTPTEKQFLVKKLSERAVGDRKSTRLNSSHNV
jgi:TPP-dependent pyruvate/acetoin dehydrogenase alpha subunit